MIETFFQADPRQQFDGFRPSRRRDALRQKRHKHVLDGRQICQKIEILKDEPDLIPAIDIALARGHQRQPPSLADDLAARGLIKRPQKVQKAALPASGGTHDKRKSTRWDLT
jgi:hypothetical protein